MRLVIVFAIGFGAGYYVRDQRVGDVERLLDRARQELEDAGADAAERALDVLREQRAERGSSGQ